MASLEADTAVIRVSNVYNIKTDMDPYIAVSDVRARLEECKSSAPAPAPEITGMVYDSCEATESAGGMRI